MQNDFNTQDPSWLNTALQAEAQLKDLEEQEQEAQAAKPKPPVAPKPETASTMQLPQLQLPNIQQLQTALQSLPNPLQAPFGINPQAAVQGATQALQAAPQVAQEVTATTAGGALDAIESVGGFGELVGDTFKTGFNQLFGRPTDDSQNPFSDEYLNQDAGWLDLPDDWSPENKTGLGKLARGLVEFGLLTAATGGIGGAVGGVLGVGTKVATLTRAAGVGTKGAKYINFIGKGAKIAGEGAIADLVSNSSEAANLANLAQEHTPWMAPWVTNALAIKPEDNPWLARIKTVASGAGVNLVGHGISAFAKAGWAAGRARAAGKSVDEANDIGNQVMQEEMVRASQLDEDAATEMAIDRYNQGYGISHADSRDEYLRTYLSEEEYAQYTSQPTVEGITAQLQDVEQQLAAAKQAKDKAQVRELLATKRDLESQVQNEQIDYEALADKRASDQGDSFDFEAYQSQRQAAESLGRAPDPFVNPGQFDDVERATYAPEPDAVKANLREAVADMKQGGSGRSYQPIATESALKAMSRGDKNLLQYINEVADDISQEAFKSLDNTMNYKEVKELMIRQASDLTSMIDEGGDYAKKFAEYFEKQDKNARIYIDDGNKIVTGSPAQKAALQLVINTLAKQAEGIATGTMFIADDLPIGRQVEMVFDAMKVALVEHKKIGYMWGLDGKYQQLSLMPKAVKEATEAQMTKISAEMEEYFESLHQMNRQGRYDEMRDLMELHALSGGKVRTLEHIHDYLRAKLVGGRMGDMHITGRVRKELQSTFYNSILSAPKTPIKAILGTNLVGILRPMQAMLGAGIRMNQQEMVIAATTIDSLGKAFAEGVEMFKYNWDLGLNRKAQTYDGKFDIETDLAEWQSLKEFYDKYANPVEQRAYDVLDTIVKFNTNPWVKYSQNAMGAGDSLARTIIGRFEMRQRAARAAIDEGIDLNDIKAVARATDENFRKEIFKLNSDNKWVVSDIGAQMAGDEAAMTRALEENFKGFELISNIPGMKAFFPFVRTGFNALNLTFQHTPLAAFSDKYKDIMNGRNLEKYGVRPQDLPQAQALMEGRIAMGSSIMGMATIAALSGNMTGDMPYDKETQDLWRAAGIQPYSFKVGNAYISYKDLEPFNTLFSMAANVVQNSNVLGEDWTDKWMQKLVFMAAAVVVDKSMLSGVEDLARLMNPETSEDLLTQTGARYIRSHLPYAGLLGQLGDVIDANQKEAQSLLETIVRRDAIVKSVLPPKYDVLSKDRSGKKLVSGAENPLFRLFNAFSPVPITPVDDDPIKKSLVEMRYNLPQTLSTYKGEPLNSLERSEMQKYLSMGSLRSRLEKIMVTDPSWREDLDRYKKDNLRISEGYQLYSQRFYQLVDDAFRDAKDEAMLQVMQNNPDLRGRIETRETKKALSKAGAYDRIMQLPK
jgi:hypothetical protein